MATIDKVWIPRSYWWNISGMYDYVKSNFPSIDLDISMHLSLIDGHEPVTQLLIPTYLLSGHGLDLKVTCKENWRNLPDTTRVDYHSWPKVHGTPQ